MLFNLPEPVSDQELEAILAASLRTGGGGISRMTELEMARVIAVLLVNGLAVAGVRAVRVPTSLRLTD